MRILFVVDCLDDLKNGTVITAVRFAAELKRLGHSVSIIAANAQGEDNFNLAEKHIFIISAISRRHGMKFARFSESVANQALSQCDVVHFITPFSLSRKMLRMAQERRVPCTAASHVQPENITYNIGLAKAEFLNKMISRYFMDFYKHFSFIHCPTEFGRNELIKYGCKAQIRVISNGVGDDFYLDKLPCGNNDVYTILMTGRFASEKKQETLLKAVPLSRFKHKIQVVLAGDGPRKAYLTRLGNKLPLPAKLRYFKKEELIEQIRRSDLYVHTGDVELESIACIEAFSCGLVPVISNSKRSAAKQFALSENNLYERCNPASLAKRIDYWLENASKREQAGLRYAAYGEQFKLSQSAIRLVKMLEECIEESASTQATSI